MCTGNAAGHRHRIRVITADRFEGTAMKTSSVVRALTLTSRAVLALMLLAVGWAVWISVTYWHGIGV